MGRSALRAGLALLVVTLLAPEARGQSTARAPEFALAPGDIVRVRLPREPELSGDYHVDEGGFATLPILGVRQVTRWPADRVKRQLVAEYDRHLRNQTAHITMLRRIRILGEVNDPGLYHVDPTMALGDALALAGGVSGGGRMDDVRVQRDGRVIRSDLTGASPLPQLRSGDQILVPRRAWLTRNTGMLIGAVLSAVTIIATR